MGLWEQVSRNTQIPTWFDGTSKIHRHFLLCLPVLLSIDAVVASQLLEGRIVLLIVCPARELQKNWSEGDPTGSSGMGGGGWMRSNI